MMGFKLTFNWKLLLLFRVFRWPSRRLASDVCILADVGSDGRVLNYRLRRTEADGFSAAVRVPVVAVFVQRRPGRA